MKEETRCLGVELTPKLFEAIVRKGFSAKLINNHVPDRFKLYNHGYNVEKNNFFLIFKTEDCDVVCGVQEWIIPEYKKLKND